MLRPEWIGSLAALALFANPGAEAGSVKVVYSEIPTSATSAVPGALDSAGQPVNTTWLAIEEVVVSHDGSMWVIKGRTTQATTNDSILVLGSGLAGTMFCQDGQPFKGGTTGELYDFFDTPVPVAFDDNNRIGFSARAKGGVASMFEKVVLFDGVGHTIAHQMGDPALGLIDVPANPTGDELFGNSINGLTLFNDGTFQFTNTPITNCHSSRYPALFRGGVSFKQSGVSTIGGEVWDNFGLSDAGATPDGAHWFAEGDTENANTAIDGILVVDDAIVMREGSPVAGTSVIFADAFFTRMLSNGDWFSRGDDPADNDWAVRNNVMIARTGDPIVAGSTETWGVSFSGLTGNRVGDWVLTGNTSETDVNKDNVLVMNGQRVIAREGDPVDVDGNGAFDDDAFIASFQPNDLQLTDDETLYYLVTLRNGAGTVIGDAFLVDTLCGATVSYGAGCAGAGGFIPVMDLTGCKAAGGNVTLTIEQGLGGSYAVLVLGLGQASLPMAGGCTLLVSPLPDVITVPLGGVGAGAGSIAFPTVLPADIPSLTFFMQAFVADRAHFWGFSNSAGVEVTID